MNIVRRPDIGGGIDRPSLEDREARLRALTSGGASTKRDAAGLPKATMVGSSDEDEDEYYDEDGQREDLFDDEPKSRTKSSIPSRPSKPPPQSLSKSSVSSARPQGSRPRPCHSSPPPIFSRPAPKPSDVISSIISKPKPRQLGSSPPPPKDARSRSGSPGMPKPPMFMPKKRTEVDIFNRGAKKPRIR